MYDYASSVLAFAGAARLAVHRGDRVEADRQLTRAMRARPSLTYVLPTLAVRVRLQLGKVYCALGDHTSARHLLREIDDILLQRPALGTLVDEVSEFQKSLASSAQVRVDGGSPLSSAELRLLPYLQTHLTIREIGDRLFVSRNTVSSELGSIYRKLGVSSRNDAVQRATEIGLLGS
jgi:LuxR family maltose regulon positive regulatory protein